MPLRLVPETMPPDDPRDRIVGRVRKTVLKTKPHCTTCGGGEYVTTKHDKVTAKLCLVCLMQGRRREVSVRG